MWDCVTPLCHCSQSESAGNNYGNSLRVTAVRSACTCNYRQVRSLHRAGHEATRIVITRTQWVCPSSLSSVPACSGTRGTFHPDPRELQPEQNGDASLMNCPVPAAGKRFHTLIIQFEDREEGQPRGGHVSPPEDSMSLWAHIALTKCKNKHTRLR